MNVFGLVIIIYNYVVLNYDVINYEVQNELPT